LESVFAIKSVMESAAITATPNVVDRPA